jgi:hypothetical protein
MISVAWAKRRRTSALTAVVFTIAIVRAWQLRWVSDDAFISFRYADNLVRGNGLVWNVGERVEGYTNFLWTMILAAGAAMRLDPVVVSEVLGVASFAALLAVIVPLSTVTREGSTSLPLVAWMLALMTDIEVWATGGLETMTFTLLAAASVLVLFRPATSARGQIAGGALLGLLVLMRPEGLLLAAIAIAWFGATRGRAIATAAGAIARVALPVVVLGGAHLIFRRVYYQDWLPNTYYAKSADLPYWDQGLEYLDALFFRDYALLAIILVGVVLALRRARTRGEEPRDVVGPVLASMALLYAIYVTRSGGDFMFMRRLVPAIALGLAACGREIDRLPPRARVAVAVPLLVAASFPFPLFERWADEHHRYFGIADEASFYPANVVALRRSQGELLEKAFRDVPARFVMNGGLCMLAYYSDLPFVMEPNGLTDRGVAHQPLDERRQIGHEKHPSDEYLRARRVNFKITPWPMDRPTSFDQVFLGGGLVVLETMIYDEPTMNALTRTGLAQFRSIETLLPEFEALLHDDDCEAARARLAQMDRYYFDANPTSAPRRQRADRMVTARCSSAPTP